MWKYISVSMLPLINTSNNLDWILSKFQRDCTEIQTNINEVNSLLSWSLQKSFFMSFTLDIHKKRYWIQFNDYDTAICYILIILIVIYVKRKSSPNKFQ